MYSPRESRGMPLRLEKTLINVLECYCQCCYQYQYYCGYYYGYYYYDCC